MLPWVHPHLSQSIDPTKGRQLHATAPIRKGEVLLIDPPYAIIPHPVIPVATDPNAESNPDNEKETPLLLCSNLHCNTPISMNTGCPCPTRCAADILWCHDVCRLTDKPRHDFECTWLSKYNKSIRNKWGEYTFGMLWLIVRMLARRSTETDNDKITVHPSAPIAQFKSGWPAMEALCGTTESWSHSSVREWTVLVKKYLSSNQLPHDLSNEAVLGLICQEEANSFGLYPRETGVYPPLEGQGDRGEQFGAAVYPRASLANHSCCPNITHKPDKTSRMIFTAGRAISAGEECCIAYFDTAQKVTLKERREHLSELFRFRCGCARCMEEEGNEEEEGGGDQWEAFPGFE